MSASLLEACQDLLRHQLSTTIGRGDPGMVFDEYDAAIERERRGYVSFDVDAVERFKRAVEANVNSEKREDSSHGK